MFAGCPSSLPERIAATDWTGAPEPTLRSQLIMPLLIALGYGEHTLNKIREERSYKLKDPTPMEGSRRIRIDYEPTVCAHRLWLIEAKGADHKTSLDTLKQAHYYALHPEVRAALMVVIDADGLSVYDPEGLHWDEPLMPPIALNAIAQDFERIRQVLAADRVAAFIRGLHKEHIGRALGTELDFGPVRETEREMKEVFEVARTAIRENQDRFLHEEKDRSQRSRERILKSTGVWAVAQEANSPFAHNLRHVDDYVTAVLNREPSARKAQMELTWPAVTPGWKGDRRDYGPPRPLWWLRVVVLGACLRLRGEPGCEPLATEWARQGIRDHLLGFPDDPLHHAALRLQLAGIPLASRILGQCFDLHAEARRLRASWSAENKLRFGGDPGWLLTLMMRRVSVRMLRGQEPYTADALNARAAEAERALAHLPLPSAEWVGPATQDWFTCWERTDPLVECSLCVLGAGGGDDLIHEVDALGVVRAWAESDVALRRRAAKGLVHLL